MGRSRPLVSIGLPVYNGENFVVEAIESHLCQTLTDFELVFQTTRRPMPPKRSAGGSPNRIHGFATTAPA